MPEWQVRVIFRVLRFRHDEKEVGSGHAGSLAGVVRYRYRPSYAGNDRRVLNILGFMCLIYAVIEAFRPQKPTA